MRLRRPTLPRLVLGALAVLLCSASRVVAQPIPGPTNSAGAALGVETRLTSVRSQATWMVGGRLHFDMGGPTSFGAEGWTLAESLAVGAGDPGGGIRLTLSYAGISGAVSLLKGPRFRVGMSLLAAAGTSKVRLPVAGTEIAADNFLVLEPAVEARVHLAGPLGARASLSHRWAGGVEDLSGISGDELEGASLTFGLSIGPF